MKKPKKETKLEELERRISELEKRSIYIPYPQYPSLPQQNPFRCPICGSNGGCWHVVC